LNLSSSTLDARVGSASRRQDRAIARVAAAAAARERESERRRGQRAGSVEAHLAFCCFFDVPAARCPRSTVRARLFSRIALCLLSSTVP